MRNTTGEPYAFTTLDDDGYWNIHFDPAPKLDGNFYYETVRGPIDGGNAQMIVNLLNEHIKHIKGKRKEEKRETSS